MTPDPTNSSRNRVRDAFEALFRQDEARDEVRKVADYQKLFDGHESQIADCYREFTSASKVSQVEPVPAETPELEQLGPYKVLEQIGKGGQGIVYLARDQRLGRNVAIKVLREFSTENLMRFQREAEVASRLDDPGICTIYDSGQIDGYYFIAMRFIDGEPLSSQVHRARHNPGCEPSELVQIAWCPTGASTTSRVPSSTQARRTDLEPTLLYFERAARALHTAHEASLIHRDVKPGNLMVSREGKPVLLDFGLAREDDPEEDLTAVSANIGTPEYMSPEQIDPRVLGDRSIDRRTDVYSLGVTLYECLTLHRPFEAPNWATQIQKVLQSDLPNPTKHNHKISRDLRAVLEMATEKDVDRRYRTALDLAEELRRIRENEPILAQPTGTLRRIGKWTARNPVLAGSMLGLVVFVVVLLGLLLKLDDTYARLSAEQAKVAEKRVSQNRQAFAAFDTAEFLMEHGKWEGARKEFARAQSLGFEDSVGVSLGIAQSFFGEQDFDEARRILAGLRCATDNKHAGSLLLLQGILTPTDLQHPDAGLGLVRQALATGKLTPADQAYARAATAETIEDVRRNLTLALRLDRHHIHANQAQAIVLLNSGLFEEAMSFAQTYQTLFPKDNLGYLIQAVCTRQLKGKRDYLTYMDSLPIKIGVEIREQFGFFAGTFELFRVLETELLLALTNQRSQRSAFTQSTSNAKFHLKVTNKRRSEFAKFLKGTLPFIANRIVSGLDRGDRLIHCRLPLAIGRAWSTLARVFTLIQMSSTTSDDFVNSMTKAIAHMPDGVFYLLRGQIHLHREETATAFGDFKLAAQHSSLFNIETTALILSLHTAADLYPSKHNRFSAGQLRFEARTAIRKLLEKGKRSWLIYKFCIDKAIQVGDLETAAEASEHWIRNWPSTSKPWIEKSKVLIKQGYFYKAQDIARRAVSLTPKSAVALQALHSANQALLSHQKAAVERVIIRKDR